MKIAVACFFAIGVLVVGAGAASAQFNGKLVYQVDQNNVRLVMTYYQRGTMGLMAAYNVSLKQGVPDSSTLRAQDTILFDFTAATETHMQYRTGNAFKQKYMGNMEAAFMAARMKGKASLTVTSNGADTVNGYHCTHYVSTSVSPMGTSTRDIWTTNDIGSSPTLWVAGSFLYFTPGYPQFTQLVAAGASGVVVKAASSYSRQGLQYTMNLISIDQHQLRGLLFTVPSRYNVIDETNMTLPTH